MKIMTDIQKTIEELKDKLNNYSYHYYVLNESLVSDFEFDKMLRELENLEEQYPEYKTSDSPTVRVGGSVQSGFNPVTHEVPLESLVDAFSYDELNVFFIRVQNTAGKQVYSIEPKVDGLSVAVEYTDGLLTRGVTRGDGITGEDVTENIKTIKSLPLKIQNAPHRLIVRGEVYMSKKVFEQINDERDKLGQPLLANPRNAAAGSLRQLDPKVAAKRRLDIVIFNVQYSSEDIPATHIEAIEMLKKWRFNVIPYHEASSYDDATNIIADIGDNRDRYPYDIDGAVIKVNDLNTRTVLGSTAKAPRWAIAYKYPPEKKYSEVISIVIQVGRTGVLTPKAVLKPVRLAGTTVTNATLHNEDFIREKDIRVGDTVLVQKAGEIIPEILEVDLKQRKQDSHPFRMPEFCPICGAPVIRFEDEAAARCTGAECPAQLLRSITHFASRDAMDIDGLGPSIIELLINNDLIHNSADLYFLEKEDLIKLDRLGDKSAENLLKSINESKSRGLSKLLYAFGIRHVGQKAAEILSEKYNDIDNLINVQIDELTGINEIGPKIAESIVNWFSNSQSIHLISLLKKADVKMTEENKKESEILAGKNIVVTGTLSKYSRKEINELIKANGGNPTSSVSKKTDFVIAGEDAGSKLTKARELNVNVISEEEFERILSI